MRHLFLATLAAFTLATGAEAQGVAPMRHALRSVATRVLRCVDESHTRGETVGARLAVELRIAPSGRVTRARIDGARGRFGRCVAKAVRRVRFPRQPSPVVVRYPLHVHAAP